MITKPPVKINLGLNILRKREDGYHDIETLFLPSSQFHDTLEIVCGDDYSRTSARLAALYGDRAKITDLSCTAGSGIDPFESDDIPTLSQGISGNGKLMMTVARKEGVEWAVLNDLCARAYVMLDEEFGLPPVKIFLEKTSPVGAGLGGGSADAAYTLKMLNDLFSLGLSNNQLAGYAARIGSDCAFFIYNRPMFGEGRGEILSDFHLDPDLSDPETDPYALNADRKDSGTKRYELKIVVPDGIHISTKEAYSSIMPKIPPVRIREAAARPVEEWKTLIVNDFEESVFKAHPELKAIKDSLYDSGAVYASMSGSGSALYAIYDTSLEQSEAGAIVDNVPCKGI